MPPSKRACLSRLESLAQLRGLEAADLDDQRRNEQLASGTVNANLDELNQAGLVRLPELAAALCTIVSLLGGLMESVERREFFYPDIKSRKMRLLASRRPKSRLCATLVAKACACDGQAYDGRAPHSQSATEAPFSLAAAACC